MRLSVLPVSLRARLVSQSGQTMAEYSVVLAMITLAVVVAIFALSGGISRVIDGVTSVLP